MPVEIRELVIRAVASSEPETESIIPAQASQSEREEIVQECVKQVLRILKKEKER